jgi:hypothetical protein
MKFNIVSQKVMQYKISVNRLKLEISLIEFYEIVGELVQVWQPTCSTQTESVAEKMVPRAAMM